MGPRELPLLAPSLPAHGQKSWNLTLTAVWGGVPVTMPRFRTQAARLMVTAYYSNEMETKINEGNRHVG